MGYRETGDHGPYNSWDRQPYLTRSGHADGYNESGKHGAVNASILKAHDIITKNFIINGYNGAWTIDHGEPTKPQSKIAHLLHCAEASGLTDEPD